MVAVSYVAPCSALETEAALVTNEEFDIEALGRLVEDELASYARPIFVRILPQMEITGILVEVP